MQADLILTNGIVYTVDARRSRHEAVAIKDGRIVAVGDDALVAECRGPRTRVVDLGGRLVLPGFIDAHMHPRLSTVELFEVNLSACHSVGDCLEAVARFAAEHTEQPVIRGWAWYPTEVPEGEMTAAALDRVVADRPVRLDDDSQHTQWVNSAMLRQLGIGRDEPGWEGAVVERLPDGSPSGLLREAWPWVDRATPRYVATAHAAAVKLFTDGVIESHTGYLAEPYADRPGFCSAPVWAPERLVEASVAAAAAGFQLHYHAIGDAAVSLSLDAIAAARQVVGAAPGRDIITHLQLVDPGDYERLAALGVVAATQPYWFAKDAMYDRLHYQPFLGEPRAGHQYPMRSLFDHGVVVAGASDYPVSPPPDPLLAIQRGTLRRDPLVPDLSSELWPEEAVSVEQLIAAFTINGAYANFLEHETGSLEAGKSADLVVLRENILELPAERVNEATVELTLFRGKPTFAAEAYEGMDLA